MSLAIGVDIGGTKVAAGVVDLETGKVLRRRRISTPSRDGEEMAAVVVGVVRDLAAGNRIAGVGLGVAGFVNGNRDDVYLAANLTLPKRPLVEIVHAEAGLPTVLENDANAATWGEYQFGAARGHHDVLMITVGTGIGGGAIFGGRLYRGARGTALEVGHIQVVPHGRKCGCGARGCWEAYGSGTAMTASARAQAATVGRAGAMLRELARGKPDGVTGPIVTEAALAGDDLAVRLIARAGSWLGLGIANLVTVMDPGVVVIGGGLGDAGELLLAPLRRAFEENSRLSGQRSPAIVRAALGNDAGIIGAAHLSVVSINGLVGRARSWAS